MQFGRRSVPTRTWKDVAKDLVQERDPVRFDALAKEMEKLLSRDERKRPQSVGHKTNHSSCA